MQARQNKKHVCLQQACREKQKEHTEAPHWKTSHECIQCYDVVREAQEKHAKHDKNIKQQKKRKKNIRNIKKKKEKVKIWVVHIFKVLLGSSGFLDNGRILGAGAWVPVPVQCRQLSGDASALSWIWCRRSTLGARTNGQGRWRPEGRRHSTYTYIYIYMYTYIHI